MGAYLAYVERAEIPFRGGPLGIHRHHVGAARAPAQVVQELLERRLRTFGYNLNRGAVGQITDPAEDAEPPGVTACEVPEKYALHAAAHQCPDTSVITGFTRFCHCLLTPNPDHRLDIVRRPIDSPPTY